MFAASVALAFNDDDSLYDPKLMSEVVEAAKRENLEANTVFAMDTGPTPWAQVLELIKKSQGS